MILAQIAYRALILAILIIFVASMLGYISMGVAVASLIGLCVACPFVDRIVMGRD